MLLLARFTAKTDVSVGGGDCCVRMVVRLRYGKWLATACDSVEVGASQFFFSNGIISKHLSHRSFGTPQAPRQRT
ncbi:hypothetical protein ACLOJK_004890 [Asimina triloba]